MSAVLYSAFISYSHRDEPWARWLQRALERYRVPRRLVGAEGKYGLVPKRLRPVFRDREDLSSAADLSEQIRLELDRAECLVVICSPAAAGSRWVNEEIRRFRESGRGDRILALVVDGDPRITEGPGSCFPRAMLDAADGARHEPLAADVRKYADGKGLALLKIVAGLLGLRLDELRQREAQRRLRRLVLILSGTLSVVAVIAWLSWSGATTRAASQAQRANAEELLHFMLGDLERLDPIPGVEVISPSDEKHRERKKRLGLASLEDQGLLQNALAWREEGLTLNSQGRLPEAQEKFLDSHIALVELYIRDERDPERVFELSQAEYYVGEVHMKQSELDAAQQHWSQYGALARRLMNLDPANPAYVMELSYSLLNLAIVEQYRPQPNISWVLDINQAALEYNQMAVLLDPGNADYRASLDNTLAWQADALRRQCLLEKALDVRQQGVDLAAADVLANPADMRRQEDRALRLTGLALVQEDLGRDEEAQSSYRAIVQGLRRVFESDPENRAIEWKLLQRESLLASHQLDLGDHETARTLIEQIAPRLAELSADSASLDAEQRVDVVLFELDRARVSLAVGATVEGERMLRSAAKRIIDLAALNTGGVAALSGLVEVSFAYWEQFGELPAVDLQALVGDYLANSDTIENCSVAEMAVRKALMEGDQAAARRLAAYALGKGYRKASFLALCDRYPVCNSD